jgi:hypothetical protein
MAPVIALVVTLGLSGVDLIACMEQLAGPARNTAGGMANSGPPSTTVRPRADR